jgi:hypothetical protein
MSAILDWWFSIPADDRVGVLLYPLAILGNLYYLVKAVKTGFKSIGQAKTNRRIDNALILINVLFGMNWLSEDKILYVVFSSLMVVTCVADTFVVNRWVDKESSRDKVKW